MFSLFLKGGLAFLMSISTSFLVAQQLEIDSLKSSIQTQKGIDKIKSLNELSWYYKNIDIDSAFLFSKESLNEAHKLKDKSAIISAYISLANVYDGVGKLDSSEYFHRKALNLGLELNDSTNIAASYNNLGIVYDLQGANEKSLKMYFDALGIYEALNDDPYSIAMVLGNIGVVYKKLKQFDNTVTYYTRALKIYEEVGSDFGIMVTQGNIGGVLINLEQYDESIAISKKSLEGYINAGYGRYIPYIEHNLAVAYDSLGNYSIARNFYNAAIEKHEQNKNYNELAVVLNSYSDFLYRNSKYSEGLEVAKKAYQDAFKADAVELRIDALNNMANNSAAIGNYEEAYRYNEKYTLLKDSLLEVNNAKQIFELQTKYETEQKERKLLAQDIELQKSIETRRLQVGVIVFLLLILSVFFWRFRIKRRQQQIEAQLAMNQERNRIAMDLHDHVGAELTLVSSKLDTKGYKAVRESEKEELEAISNQIRNVNKILKETVWSIREESIQISQLLYKVKDFVDKQFEGKDIAYSDTSNNNAFKLAPQIALTLFRVCQEGITNTFKYAQATAIDLTIFLEGDSLIVQLTDNGNGFSVNTTTKGYGLQNMEQRIAKLKGKFKLTSDMSSGTAIYITIPV